MSKNHILSNFVISILLLSPFSTAIAKPPALPPLTAPEEEAMQSYAKQLDTLRAELKPKLPELDPAKLSAFQTALEANKNNEIETLKAARPLLADLNSFLSSPALDEKLIRCAIITSATPEALARFVSQGPEQKKLIDILFSNPALMKEMLLEGGAKGGRYGHAMEIFRDIHAAADHPVEGVYHRIALAISLELAAMDLTGQKDVDPIARYKFYAKSYADGQLDSYFDKHSVFLLRQVINDPYTEDNMAWMREMLWNYRPDMIKAPKEFGVRYVAFMHSEFGHKRPEWDDAAPTTRMQQCIDRGGQCGPKAMFGRSLGRAFGVPVWGARLRSHTAMMYWSPGGWSTVLGVSPHTGFWNADLAEPMKGSYFLLQALARQNPEKYAMVCRARWVGDVLAEDDVNGMSPDQGGTWNLLADHIARDIALDGKEPANPGRPIWTNDSYGNDDAKQPEEMMKSPVTDKDRIITTDSSGVIRIPAVATTFPKENTDKILFMEGLDGKLQLHYKRWKDPEPITYEVTVPAAGTYQLTAETVTVNRDQFFNVTINNASQPLRMEIPYTVGKWGKSAPLTLSLQAGKNTITLNRTVPEDFEKEGYRYASDELGGITLRTLTLTPGS